MMISLVLKYIDFYQLMIRAEMSYNKTLCCNTSYMYEVRERLEVHAAAHK